MKIKEEHIILQHLRASINILELFQHQDEELLGRYVPQCKEDGSFEEVQCRGLMCFCVDPDNGRAVKETNINTLFGEPRCGETGRKPKSAFMQMKLVTQFQIKIAHERDGESVNAL